MTGVYLILVELSEGQRIQTGGGACFSLAKGFYGYVGSALGGLEKRVARHLSAEKKLHWHIDYLMDRGRVRVVICAETKQKEECLVASALSQRLSSISGFGSSDCDCRCRWGLRHSVGESYTQQVIENLLSRTRFKRAERIELDDLGIFI